MGLCPECLLHVGSSTATGATPLATEEGRFVPPAPEALARYFPQLEILELLGHGGMGAVYKARQKELDRVVALKILPPGISHDRSFSQRFTREAQALARLNHPHIVTLYDFGQADGLFYFFMEYVDGMNLRQLLDGRRLSPDEALAIVPQICDALQYAHDRGIVHRDIKPENLLLGKDGQVKIADFGVARIVAGAEGEPPAGAEAAAPPEATVAGRVLGTPQYMAPEQRSRPGEVDHRADIYSLGVVFYQLLTGELPGRPLELPSRKVEIDVRLDEVVLRALEHEPDRRYRQASGLKAEVETIAATRRSFPESRAGRFPVFAGFWRRAAALLIDYALVSVVAFPLVVLLVKIVPGAMVVEVPFGLLTPERVVEEFTLETGEVRLVETRPLGKWRYLYLEETETRNGQEATSRHLVDPDTRLPLEATSAGSFYLWLLLLYGAVMESSRRQATLGKTVMRIHVADRQGRRLSLARALGRNFSKIISALFLGLGFFMAGVSREKQALHDKMVNCLLFCGPPSDKEKAATSSFWDRFWKAAVVLAIFGTAVAFPLFKKAYHDHATHRRMAQLQTETVGQVEKHLKETRLMLDDGQEPLMPRLLETFERGERQEAVRQFNQADWSTRLLFAPDSPFSLSEEEFVALPRKERNRRHEEATREVKRWNQMVKSVFQAGREAASQRDFARARACFESLKAFGRALDRPGGLLLSRVFGVGIEKKAAEEIAKLPVDATPVNDLRFSPIIERTLGDMTAKGELPELLNLKSGALFFQSEVTGGEPLSDAEEYGRRLRRSGTNVGGTLLAGDRGLIGWELAVVPESPDVWERLSAREVHQALAKVPLRNPVILHGTGTLPATYLFRTRTGEEGVLQITGFSEKPPGVKVRYKLVEGLSPVAPAADEPPTMDRQALQLKAWPGEVYSVDGEECDLDGLYGKLSQLAFQQSEDRKVIPMSVSVAKGVDQKQAQFLAETARAFGINSREVLAGNPAAVPPSRIRKPRFQIRAEADDKEEAEPFADSNGTDTIRLGKKVWLDESDVRSAGVEVQNGNRLIQLKLTINGTRKFAALTHAFLHKRVALLFDGKVLAAPVIQVPIYGGVLYHSSLNLSEAEETALLELLSHRNATPAPNPASPVLEAMAEPPQLRALNWQDGAHAGAGQAWLPSGEPVPEEEGLPPASRMDHQPATGERFLVLWFSHPLFDARSIGEITLFQEDGETPLSVLRNDFALRQVPATEGSSATGWLVASVNVGNPGEIPPRATVSLRYSAGPWKEEGVLPVTFNGSRSLGTRVIVNAPGQEVSGNAFVQISRERFPDREERQYSFVALLADGSLLEPDGRETYGTGKISVERISFPVSLSQIQSFQIQSRPIHGLSVPIVLKAAANHPVEVTP